jgi:hypothetical protein
MPLLNHDTALITVLKTLSSSAKWAGLAHAIKGIIERNPFEDDDLDALMWIEQSAINFPILYLSCLYLYIFAQQKGIKTFLFASRDCCHMSKMFIKMFPETDSHYFNCSRNMFETGTTNPKGTSAFHEYVTGLVGNNVNESIYVDVHGTGKRVFAYFEQQFHEVPYCFLLSATCRDYDSFPPIARKYERQGKLVNLGFNIRGGPIESLNYDLIGTLQGMTEDGPIRDKLEYEYDKVEPYHRCVDFIIKHLVPLDGEAIIAKYDLYELRVMISKIFTLIQNDQPAIAKKFEHVKRHDKANLKIKCRTKKKDKKRR